MPPVALRPRLALGLGLVVGALACGIGSADELVLKNGARLTGVIEQETDEGLRVHIGIEPRLTFAWSEVATVHRASAEENARLQAAWAAATSGQPVAGSEPEEPARTLAAKEGSSPGRRPPAFTAVDLEGTARSLSGYRGRVLVLHFWASWCPYCRGEIPKLKAIHHQWASQGVRVLTVSVDEDLGALQRFVASSRLPYPVIADRRANPPLARQYRVSGIPVTLVLGRDGRIAFRSDGAADIAGAVQRVLAQAPTASAH